MKTLPALSVVALLLAGAAAFLIWQSFPSDPTTTPADDVSNLEAAFIRDRNAEAIIPVDELRESRLAAELFDPTSSLPQLSKYPFDEIAAVARFADDCNGTLLRKVRARFSPALEKAIRWHASLCEGGRKLPKDFFETAPFMHPSGKSYARLAVESGRVEYRTPDWREAHLRAFHVREILESTQLLDGKSTIVISPYELSLALRGENLILGTHFVFLSLSLRPSYQRISPYAVFHRSSWERFVRNADLISNDSPMATACLVKEGNVCWQTNTRKSTKRFQGFALFFLIAFLATAAYLIFEWTRRLGLKKREEQERLFTLQMLTHELRTPATSLRLSLESFRRQYDLLPEPSQKAFLHMCGEVQRLDRVVEMSRHYLGSSSVAPETIGVRQVPSANEFVADLLRDFPESVTFVPLTKDEPLAIDRYWVELCVRNLLENAVRHGEVPIAVELRKEGKMISVSVRDSGQVSLGKRTLDDMARPFHKSDASLGLGLGLSIVKHAVESRGGEMRFRENPTTFSIRLPEAR